MILLINCLFLMHSTVYVLMQGIPQVTYTSISS